MITARDIIKAGGKLPAGLIEPTEKYHRKKTEVDGILFDSLKEANHYSELKIRKKAGLIKDFERQAPFTVYPKFRRGERTFQAIKIKVDFVVTELDGSKTIEEVKSEGTKTRVYQNKRKMLLDQYPEYAFKEV